MFGRRYGISNPLHISTASRNELKCTGSSHPQYLRTNPTLPYRDSIMNGSRKESALSPQSLFSYDGEYLSLSLKKFQESSKDTFLTELSGESNFYELPDSSLLSELPEDSLDHDQSTLVAGNNFLNNQKRISSTSRAIVSPSSASNGHFQSLDTLEAGLTVITELPCVDGDQVGYRTPWYIETQESTPIAGHCLSDNFGFGNAAEAEIVDKTAEIRIQMDAACLSQDSSISMPLQSLRSLGSMCPAIQTDLRRFKCNLDATQHQRGLFEDSPQISSPDTASTNTSGETFSSDSGYGPRAPQSDYTSTTSPRSLFPGDEWLGFENTFSILQSNQPNDFYTFGLANIHSELDDLCRDQQMQASYLSDFKDAIFESGEMEIISNSLSAHVAQNVTDIDQRLANNFSIDDDPQYMQSTILRDFSCLKTIISEAENCETPDAATFTPAMDTEIQHAPNLFEIY
ncbi:hypothetical protein BOTNAR_0630g00050 [Botryotinia narcissicola]|uniref:Uncharacterized protein n=1 Tax=Botryotinia narcissicola TaxID=278944 RepID=A0A4Z1HA31_9HELO|nr:hypothetical protein BOTNAR_0630g00050 [Botryotinia narcissicola]